MRSLHEEYEMYVQRGSHVYHPFHLYNRSTSFTCIWFGGYINFAGRNSFSLFWQYLVYMKLNSKLIEFNLLQYVQQMYSELFL